MNITEKEFQAMLNKNPAIKARWHEKNKPNSSRTKSKDNVQAPAGISDTELMQEQSLHNKYRNIKLYEYESGLVSANKKEINAGKIVAVFDSIKEYNRWCDLQLLQKAKRIQDLRRQVRLPIQEAFVYQNESIRAIDYVADFCYASNGQTVIEDVKPRDTRTDQYRLTKDFVLKWKLLKHRYPTYLFVII